jgi:hypothetical protein
VIIFFVYFCGIWDFCSSRKHLLITLLRLKFVVLVLYFSIYFYLCSFTYSLFVVGFFFCLWGSLGLSILVSMIRIRCEIFGGLNLFIYLYVLPSIDPVQGRRPPGCGSSQSTLNSYKKYY